MRKAAINASSSMSCYLTTTNITATHLLWCVALTFFGVSERND